MKRFVKLLALTMMIMMAFSMTALAAAGPPGRELTAAAGGTTLETEPGMQAQKVLQTGSGWTAIRTA